MTAPRNVHFEPGVRPPTSAQAALRAARKFLDRHGKKLWWLHSVYALGLGVFVVAFAQRGFDHARWLAVTLGVTWLLVVLFFRASVRETTAASPTHVKVRFYMMTYVLKNLYQGMLFFLLPFYWKAATPGALNFLFVLLLAACALLSTMDIVVDRVLLRVRALASVFHAITLFGCMNLVVPALFTNTRNLWTLVSAGALTAVGFWTLHVPFSVLKDKRAVALLAVSVGLGGWVAYLVRRAIPPVPMYLAEAAVGPSLLPDGRLAMEVTTLHSSVLGQLICVTDVGVPGGKGDRLVHVWKKGNQIVYRAPEEMSRVAGPFGTARLQSTVSDMPKDAVGSWTVEVETDDGQLVGRVPFRVVE